ncbi:kinesin associated protein 3 isoform X2 [Amblyomma americanum]
MQPDDVAPCIKRNFRNCELDVHPTDKALVVRYEVEAVVLGDGPAIEQTRACQKLVRVKSLNASTDLAALAREVVAKCDLLHESQTAQVERLLSYLQQRRDTGSRPQTGFQSATQHGGLSPSGGRVVPVASMACLESYIDMLYEEAEDKLRGSAMVLQLARSPDNLGELAANDTLLCALARVLREDGRRDTQLATNLAYVFFCLSTFSQFHPVIAEYKVGSICLDLVEYELRRHAHWKEELSRAPDDERSRRKFVGLTRRQDHLLRVCLYLLLNVAEESRSEIKMVNRGLVPMLVECLEREQTDLLLLAVCFLKKLSIYYENQAEMARLPTIERLTPLLSREPLTSAVLRLLLNLSFDRAHRAAMSTAGLIPKLVQHLIKEGRSVADETPVLCILYHLSLDDRCKSQFPYTDCIPWLVRCLLSSQNPQPAPLALAISLASHRRNAQLFSGALDKLLERALRDADALFLRLVRTVAQHCGSARGAPLSSRAEALCSALIQHSSSVESDFAVECASTLAQLEGGPFGPLLDKLLPWIRSCLSEGPDELLVPLVQLVATVARSGEACAKAVVQQGLVVDLTGLLRARQEDDQLVLQVAYVFDALVSSGGPSVQQSLVQGAQEVPAYLLDLLHDRNPEVGRVCGHALVVLAHHYPEWDRRLREARFCWHNAQWLAVVQSGEVPEEHEEGPCEQFLDRSDLLSNGSATSDP